MYFVPGVLHELSLSACHEREFTCGEGSCVDLSHRCDLRVDCPDNSDEIGCEKLELPDEYLESLPPPASTPGPLTLNLTVALQGLSKVGSGQCYLSTSDISAPLLVYFR